MSPCDCSDTLRTPDGACVLCADEPAPASAEPAPAINTTRWSALVERKLLERSFARFAAWGWPLMTGQPLVRNRATDAIAAALQDVADGRTTRLLVAVPPGTGKSTMLALYAAWRLARDPSWRSIHAMHSFELAATESRRVRRLVEGDEFKRAFPSVVIRADESSVAHWATTRDGRYFAVGTDGALIGRRAHEAVVDDPLSGPDRFSKAARDGLWAWFTESLSTRLDGDRAPMIVVHQRLDRDDLIGRLIAAGGWTLLELPAEDERGELLAPSVLGRAKLDAMKKQIGAQAYATMYLQRPASDDSAAVKRAWWRFHRGDADPSTPRPAGCDTNAPAVETPERFDRIVIAVDMTFGSTKDSADYADVAVWGAARAGRYLIERWHKRATQLEQRAAIRALARKYPHAKILVEKAAGGAGAIEQLTADGIPNIVPVVASRSKAERLSLVSPTIEAGNCFLPLGAPWVGEFVEELAGASRHDDAMDTTAYAVADLNAGAAEDVETREGLIGLVALGHWGPHSALPVAVDQVLRSHDLPLLSPEEIRERFSLEPEAVVVANDDLEFWM
ncbi:MAG: hypothetical protein KIT31_13885 [Deltaproteobacteria bacterium]|nr:hypothetical protein [Deltaproteobacteria bacterium]